MPEPVPARHVPGAGSGARPPGARPRVGRLRIGCLGALVLGLLFVVAFELLFNPWAFHMGGRLTPLTEWEGVGVLHGSNGARDALHLRIWLKARGMTVARNSTRSRGTFNGLAIVRTPQGETRRYTISGELRTTWWSAEGVPMSLRLFGPKNERPHPYFDLYGAFDGARLLLDDHGSSGRLFRPDGSIDPIGFQHRSTAEHPWVRVTLEPGTDADFEALAAQLARPAHPAGP